MRFVATLLLWVVATAALAVAVPTTWAQHDVVDRDGYARLAEAAARDTRLQQAMANELTTQITQRFSVNASVVRTAASVYTASEAFPGQFAQANQLAHRWMFTEAATQDQGSGAWQIDLGPMLADTSIKDTLESFGVTVPESLPVELDVSLPDSVRPGQLRQLTKWGPWVSTGAIAVTAVFALLTVAVARKRGKALAALGVSALLVGAAGWAAIEIYRRRLDDALAATSGDIRQMADVMVGQAISSLHVWLTLTLAAGGLLVALGVVAAVLGAAGSRQRTVSEPLARG